MNEAKGLTWSSVRALWCSARAADVFFFGPYAVWLVYGLFSRSFFAQMIDANPYLQLDNIFIFVTSCLLVREACQTWLPNGRSHMTLKSTSLAILVLCICGYGLLVRNAQRLMLDMFLIVAARNVDKNRFIKCSFYCISACLVIIVCASLFNVIPNVMLIQNTRIRYCLGFRYCLMPANILFTITCLWCLINEGRMHALEMIAYLVMNAVMYVLTDSRLVFACSIIVILSFFVYGRLSVFAHRFRVVVRAGRVLLANSTYICIFVTLVVTVGYGMMLARNPELASRIGVMFGRRVMRGYQGLVNMGVNVPGQVVTWVGNGLSLDGVSAAAVGDTYNYVDNIYLHVLIEQGILYAAFHFVALNSMSRRAVARHAVGLAVVLAAVAFCGLLDDHAIVSYYNPFVLLVLNGL